MLAELKYLGKLWGYFTRLFGWLDNKMAFPTAVEPKPSFTSAVTEIVEFNKFISDQACPNCHKKDTFVAIDYERGNRGFEAKVLCKACLTTATVNTTGFHYEVKKVPKGEAT